MASAAQVRELLKSLKNDVVELKQAVADLEQAGKRTVEEEPAAEEAPSAAAPEEKTAP